jgi:hypothetical protein
MAVVPITPDQAGQEPRLELFEDRLDVAHLSFQGTIVGVAHELDLAGDRSRLARLLSDAVEVGATILRNGQSQALVEAVALEIDRLIETATSESKKIPQALKEPLGEHLTKLADLLAQHFDPQRARSLQSQIKTLVGEATGMELRTQIRDLLGEDGAVGSQVRLFTSSNAELLTRVTTVLDKIEQKLQLDQAMERSAHKGRPFEEIVQAELEAIHSPLGDEVHCVRAEYGLLPKTSKGAKAGDFIVNINPEHTRGREVVYVIEAKAGALRAAEAKRELETAIKNRGATAGVLVFDGLEDAPLGGRSYMPHGDRRFTAVLDLENGAPLAFEVACREARLAAIASVRTEGELDKSWLASECSRLCDIVEEASGILRGVSTVERGAIEIRERYAQMRLDALSALDKMRKRAEE